jgi:hypothetical protein
MKKGIKILLIIFSILILLVIVNFFLAERSSLCGTPFYVRNAETGICEIKVGCSLPTGVSEDPACEEELRQQIDSDKTSN